MKTADCARECRSTPDPLHPRARTAPKIAAQPPHPHYADLQQQCSEFRVGFEALSRDPELRKLDVQVQLAELNIDTHKLEFLK